MDRDPFLDTALQIQNTRDKEKTPKLLRKKV